MKKLGLGILVAVIVLAVSGIAVAISNQGAEKAKAPDLEKIEFIHWKKDFAKPDKPGKGGGPKEPACYAFLGKYGKTYLKWSTLPVSYVINPVNPQEFDEGFVCGAITASVETWDAATESTELFTDYTECPIDDRIVYGVQDYKNAISLGDYPADGVIAVTTVWYNPATKVIIEFDVMFDTDFAWGDATLNSAVMDLQNIAIHELGHGVGLADVYETACSDVTMYGYSDYGEIQKRTLEQPDITGIQALYGGF